MAGKSDLYTVSSRLARSAPGPVYKAYIRALNGLQVRRGFSPIVVEEGSEGWSVYEPSTGRRVALTHRGHAERYLIGVENQMSNLANSYGVARVIRPGDVVVESGAWAGEIGMFVTSAGCDYYAFEPDPVAFAALSKNVPTGVLTNAALWMEDGELDIHVATAFGDSGVFATANTGSQLIRVPAVKLDTFAQAHGLTKIRAFKLEAEGAEPEVLSGARETLPIIDYVAIDAGPERDGESTLTQCAQILQAAGFTMCSFNHRRMHVMFRNERLDPADQPRDKVMVWAQPLKLHPKNVPGSDRPTSG